MKWLRGRGLGKGRKICRTFDTPPLGDGPQEIRMILSIIHDKIRHKASQSKIIEARGVRGLLITQTLERKLTSLTCIPNHQSAKSLK